MTSNTVSFNAAPVAARSNGCYDLVDVAVLDYVDLPGDGELALGIRDDLLILEHELVAVKQLLLSCSALEQFRRTPLAPGHGRR